MSVVLFDTYTRAKQPLVPLRPPAVGLYTCGPTVYHDQHIGNYRTFLFEDALKRALRFHGYQVDHVMNITDVGHLTSDADTGEDKIEKGARRTGLSAWEVAEHYTRAFVDDLGKLHIERPGRLCRATEHIADQIRYIEELEAKGFTYDAGDGIYFDTSKLATYGHLARLDVAGLRGGKRVDLGGKRHVTDFALWKRSSTPGLRQMEWPSPWGVGFPGWHIECSAMAERYLGPLFDIHCGGEDHIPVHHSNEIAQSEARSGTRLASIWMHGSFLTMGGGKISKSEERPADEPLLGVQELSNRGHAPLAFRYLCLTSHYRGRLAFTWDGLEAAEVALTRLRRAIGALPEGGEPHAGFVEQFGREIGDDLGFPAALALVHELVRGNLPAADRRATALRCDQALGLGLDQAPAAEASGGDVGDDVARLVEQRQQARKARSFAEADRLRDEILARGYAVIDTPDGYRIERA